MKRNSKSINNKTQIFLKTTPCFYLKTPCNLQLDPPPYSCIAMYDNAPPVCKSQYYSRMFTGKTRVCILVYQTTRKNKQTSSCLLTSYQK